MVATELIVSLVFFSLGLIGTFFGALLATKCDGKLKRIILLLVIISAFFLIYEIGGLIQVYSLYPEIIAPVLGVLHGGVLVFTLVILANLEDIISSVKKRRR